MESFVAFSNTLHLLRLAFWCPVLWKRILEIHNLQKITTLKIFGLCKILLDANSLPKIIQSKVTKMILDKYLSLSYSLLGNTFRLRALLSYRNHQFHLHRKSIDWFLYGENFLPKNLRMLNLTGALFFGTMLFLSIGSQIICTSLSINRK